MSIVRRNLMEQQGYSPYCGAERCYLTWPRTLFDGEQFRCRCGWRSAFEPEFIAEYKAKWGQGLTPSYPATASTPWRHSIRPYLRNSAG